MSCYTDYISVDRTTPSKSGLYVVDLPGVTVKQLHDLTKDEQVDFQDFFESIYSLAQINLKIDLHRQLAGRFHIDKKLVSRETSQYLTDVNASGNLAGVKIQFILPKYARIHILSIGFKADNTAVSPEAQFFIYKDNADGELLSTITSDVSLGRNTVTVYQEFEENVLFVAYNTAQLELIKTQNKFYEDWNYAADKLSCTFPCYFTEQTASVQQINGGGLDVKFIITCSMDKLLCENLPLFQFALWYRIGVELMKERKVSDRVTRFTVLAEERAVELMAVFNEDYQAALEAATMNLKFQEDPVCFLCKRPIQAKTTLP